MNIRLVAYTTGFLLMALGCLMFVPIAFELYDGSANANAFISTAICTLFIGGLLFFSCRDSSQIMSVRSAFLITLASWAVLPLCSSFPFYLADFSPSFTNSFFEAMSGLTTTGATVFSGLDEMSRGILIWRMILQWLGGIGVIGMAIAILPFLGVGGMQLFRTESSDRSEKVLPRPGQFAFALLAIYVGLTALCGFLYYWGGMSSFDAFAHTLTTLASGGFSTHDSSFRFFDSYTIYWTTIFFMLVSGLPFILYVRLLVKGDMTLFKDSQVLTFLGICFVVISVLTLWLYGQPGYESFFHTLTHTSFSMIAIITGTGYAIVEYTAWGPFSVMIFFFIMYMGGCAGSATGGIKIVRLEIAARALIVHMKKLLYPNASFVIRYGGKEVDDRDVRSVMGFLFIFVCANVFMTMAMMLTGLDFATAISSTASAIANVGIGVGEIVGPAGSHEPLPDAAKWILSLGMFMGRLELLTFIVLFSPYFWRR